MKKSLLLFILLAVGLFGSATLEAQNCIPDTNFTNGGIYPDSLPPACNNQLYEAVITVVVPADTVPPGSPVPVPIDSVVLDEILGLPPGFTYSCEPPSCVFPGNSTGCVVLTGTPTSLDTFALDLSVTVHVQSPFGPLPLSDTLEGEFTLIVLPSPEAAVSDIQDESCLGAGDGGFTITPTAGTAPFEYSIDMGDTWQSDSVFVGVSAATYSVLVRDSSGCAADVSVVVGEIENPIEIDTVTVEQISCFGAEDGQISVLVSGGNANFTFEWNTTPPETGASIDNLGPGGYIVTVTDTNGCQKVEDFLIEEPDSIGLSLSATNDNGSGNGTATVTATGGEPGYEYLWSNGDTTEMISGLSSGVYTVTVTDELGCSAMDSIEVLLSVGIAAELFENFSLHPNPNQGSFSLNFDLSSAQELEIQLINLNGQRLWREHTGQIQQYHRQITLDNASPGIYLIQIITDQGIHTDKLLIQ